MMTTGCKKVLRDDYLKIENLVKEHELTSKNSLHLVPTENLLSPLARLFLLSDGVGRYALDNFDNGNWFLAGSENLNKIENIINKKVKSLFGARYSNIAPLSGMNCMLIMLYAMKSQTNSMFHMPMCFGGHDCTSKLAQTIGVTSSNLIFDRENLCIDVDKSAKQINKNNSSHIYLDSSMILFPHPIRELRKAITNKSIITYDGSQVMGLIAGGSFQKPLKEGADFLSGSVHKSFFGPQKAIILGKEINDCSEKVTRSAKELISNKHMNDVLAFSISLLEMDKFGAKYSSQCIKNAKAFAEEMYLKGFDVQASEKNFTQSQQVWINPEKISTNLKKPLIELAKSNIFINQTRIPSLGGELGWRIGTQEITRLGMKEEQMKEIAKIMSDNLNGKKNSNETKQSVLNLRDEFSEIKYCLKLDNSRLRGLLDLFGYSI